MNIGIFDSGLGGLSILKDIIQVLPQYNYVYLGDNARVPYGGRSQETIYEFTKQAVEEIFKRDCKLVIIACNTSSAQALRRLQQEWLSHHFPDRKILGVIRPTVEYIVEKKIKRVGIIATRATVASQSYIHEINKFDPSIKIFQNPAPLLVPTIEENLGRGQLLTILLDIYVKPLLEQDIEALLLGCTHYGMIGHHIQEYVGNSIEVINQGPIVGEKLADYLTRHEEINNLLGHDGKRELLVTDINSNYQEIGKMFLDDKQSNVKMELVKIS